ncbi:MAG TPA: sugar ABC transporter permease [Thermoflexus sp.]|nr:sugar ABC transporter permease [Thermoflexus sp.]
MQRRMRWIQWLNDERWMGQLLILPMQLLIWFVLIIPMLIVIYLSLVSWQPIMGVDWWQAPFAGLRNYAQALQDQRFLTALGRTIGLVLVAVGMEFLLGLALAIFFHQQEFPGKRLFASIILYPMMLPWVVVGLCFYLLFLDKGPVNYILISLFGPGASVQWYQNPVLALMTIALADVWQWTPFMFLVIYSGLGALPPEPIEAAMTLGASRWQIFRYIVFPMLKPVLMIALIIRALEAFKIFDLVYIMTGGGPGTSTESLSLYLYRTGFVYGQLSYAAAMALLILILVAVIARLAVRPLEAELEAR